MAVVEGGRNAITHIRLQERFGGAKPFASLIECRLETGRTHQIRVHALHIGNALIGDPVYGRPRALGARYTEALTTALGSFPRQGAACSRAWI